ncbi:MAG: peptidase domain-containing ABC transporter [Muribaculaceae bacterium]|nr:peptidase domain-containing ABC transporter [Muribaculaceae bacterium]
MARGERIHFVRQPDSMQCGAASLAMVCGLFGRRMTVEAVSRHCFATTEGVSMLGISQAAARLGLESAAGRLTLDELAASGGPAILHWNQKHFVVFYGMTRSGKFRIADPAKGLKKCSRVELERRWVTQTSGDRATGIAMFFEPTGDFSTACREVQPERSLRFLARYINRYRRYFAQIVAGLALGCVLQLIIPFLTQAIVDVGIRDSDIGFIWLVLLGELMIVAGRMATDIIRRRLLLHISLRINLSLVSDFFVKLLKLPMSFFDTKLMGDLLQRIGDHARVQNFLTQQVLGILFSVLSFLIFGIVLLVYNGLIFAVFALGSVVYGVWIASFLRRRKLLDYDLFEQQAVNNNKTYQFVTTMQEIKLQDCEERRRREWEDVQADLFDVQMRSLKLQQTQEAGSLVINEVKNIFITVLAATAVINGSMTLGAMLAVQYIIGQLNSPVDQLMGFVYSLQNVKISLERINEIHSSRNEEDRCASADSFPADGGREICFDGVGFKYDPHAPDFTVDGISITVPEGKVTAIVGASGSGKSTLVKLMLGYYPVAKGHIRVGGRELGAYSMKWWRNRCGVVMQDGVIFSESIARNIAVGDGPVDIDRLEHAARVANIHDFVMGLPLQYNTMIGRDGTGLSQGQRQRVLIARAVYKNPDYIFLDEATNALDATNEREIVANLERFYEGRTVVVVAHRLSTVVNADQIIVLDKGRVAEVGSHEELIARRGAYYSLIKNQLELGQ